MGDIRIRIGTTIQEFMSDSFRNIIAAEEICITKAGLLNTLKKQYDIMKEFIENKIGVE